MEDFLKWFKTVTLELKKKKRVFREPKIKDLTLSTNELLKKMLIEWEYKEFIEATAEITKKKQTDLINKIFESLGLDE